MKVHSSLPQRKTEAKTLRIEALHHAIRLRNEERAIQLLTGTNFSDVYAMKGSPKETVVAYVKDPSDGSW